MKYWSALIIICLLTSCVRHNVDRVQPITKVLKPGDKILLAEMIEFKASKPEWLKTYFEQHFRDTDLKMDYYFFEEYDLKVLGVTTVEDDRNYEVLSKELGYTHVLFIKLTDRYYDLNMSMAAVEFILVDTRSRAIANHYIIDTRIGPVGYTTHQDQDLYVNISKTENAINKAIKKGIRSLKTTCSC